MKSWAIPLPVSENLVLFTDYRKNRKKRRSQVFFLDHSRIWKITLSSAFRRQYLQDVLYKHVQMLQLFFFVVAQSTDGQIRLKLIKCSIDWWCQEEPDKKSKGTGGQETQNTTPNITQLTGIPNQMQVYGKVHVLFQHGMRWITHCIQLRHVIYCFCFFCLVRLCLSKISSLGNWWRHPGNSKTSAIDDSSDSQKFNFHQ